MALGTIEASKFTSLERLIAIKDNYYCGEHDKKGCQIDYDPFTVDRLIWVKSQKKFDDASKILEMRYEYERELPPNRLPSGLVLWPPVIAIKNHEESLPF